MELYKHPKAGAAVLVARTLTAIRHTQLVVKTLSSAMHNHYDLDYCAGKWPAYSEYQYCVNCGTVAKLTVPMEVTLHTKCSNCNTTAKSASVRVVSMIDYFKRIDPEVQVLALQYLYNRNQTE